MWQSSNGHEKGKEKRCSFCGKSQTQVGQLVTGPGDVSICNDCTTLFREHLEKMAGESFSSTKQLWHVCSSCGTHAPASHRYCYNCGAQFTKE